MYELGATFSVATATLAAGTLAFSFATLYYGAAMAYVTDPLAVLCTLAAVVYLVPGKTNRAAVAELDGECAARITAAYFRDAASRTCALGKRGEWAGHVGDADLRRGRQGGDAAQPGAMGTVLPVCRADVERGLESAVRAVRDPASVAGI